MGEIVARAHGELALLRERSEAVAATTGARVAEAESRLQSIEMRIAERLATLKDGDRGPAGERGADGDPGPPGESVQGPPGDPGPPGRDVDMGEVESIIARAVDALPKPRDGKDGDPGPKGDRGKDGRDVDFAQVEAAVARAVDAIPRPRDGVDGKDGTPGERGADGRDVDMGEVESIIRDLVAAIRAPADGRDGVDGTPGPAGERGPPGFLAEVRAWEDGVHYAGAVVAHDGSTWQAVRDTGKAPPHEDWICLALGGANGRDGVDGKDGADGRSFEVRGTWLDVGTYRRMDVVMLNGASFVAKRDDPGPCPGEGWQLLSSQGKRGQSGEKGERGPKGDRGPAGPAVTGAHVDGEGLLTLVNADGSVVTCDLYPLLSKLA